MQPGIIETIKPSEADERKEFWNGYLLDMGLARLYEANARWVHVPYRRLCIFIEKRAKPLPAASNGASENHQS